MTSVQTQIDKLAARVDAHRDALRTEVGELREQANTAVAALWRRIEHGPTPPGDGDHGADESYPGPYAPDDHLFTHDDAGILLFDDPEPCEESRNNNGVCRGLCAYCAPSPAPDEAANWLDIVEAYDEAYCAPLVDAGPNPGEHDKHLAGVKAAVAKAIALGLAAPADRAVVVGDLEDKLSSIKLYDPPSERWEKGYNAGVKIAQSVVSKALRAAGREEDE